MDVIGQFVVMVAFGVACAMLAQGRGRHPLAWFAIGWLLNVVGLVLLFVLPDRAEEEARGARVETDLRRQRERLAKERQVADRRYEDTLRRLAVHDRALGVDSSREAALDAGPGAPPPLPPGGAEPVPTFDALDWYYARDGAPVGPLGFDELQRLAREGWIAASTLVWSEATVDWRPAGALPELAELRHA